jgi:hypothetical protein
VRRRVLAATRRGQTGPDPAAFAAGRVYADTWLRPRGPHWWQHITGRLWLRLALAAVLGAETLWLVTSGRLPWSRAWPLAALAYLFLLLAALTYSVRRTLRRVVAVGPLQGTAPSLRGVGRRGSSFSAAPPSSGPPEQGASSSR